MKEGKWKILFTLSAPLVAMFLGYEREWVMLYLILSLIYIRLAGIEEGLK